MVLWRSFISANWKTNVWYVVSLCPHSWTRGKHSKCAWGLTRTWSWPTSTTEESSTTWSARCPRTDGVLVVHRSPTSSQNLPQHLPQDCPLLVALSLGPVDRSGLWPPGSAVGAHASCGLQGAVTYQQTHCTAQDVLRVLSDLQDPCWGYFNYHQKWSVSKISHEHLDRFYCNSQKVIVGSASVEINVWIPRDLRRSPASWLYFCHFDS